MNNKFRKIMSLVLILVVLFVLTGCSGKGTMDTPILAEGVKSKFFDYILVIPVGFIMQLFSGMANNSFAFGILATTIVIRSLAWPIYSKSNDMSIKMQIMQPDLQRVQAKYEGLTDPQSKQRMQIEMSNVYKKHNFSPMGCFMPLLQMPIFIAVYQTVVRITHPDGKWANKVSNTNLFGINLSESGSNFLFKNWFSDNSWHGFILALIVLGTNLVLTWISTRKPSYLKETHTHAPQSSEAQQQQNMMKFMPYIMAVMMFGIAITSNSLAFYWIVGNLYSIIQNLISRKVNEKKYYKFKNQDLVVKSND